ncbi:MAG: PhzF family phenazine biosynthesis protein [Bacteroidia bacterium]
MAYPFHILNVFSEGRFGGNQLIVFQLPENRDTEELLRITRETNIAEAAFLIGEPDAAGRQQLRVFTREAELPTAGHAAIGAAWVAEQGRPELASTISMAMESSESQVRSSADGLRWMKQLPPIFSDTLSVEALSPVLRLNPAVFHPQLPIQIVSTGRPFILVPLRHLDAVKQANLHPLVYYNLIKETQAKAIMLFAPQVYERGNDYNVRVFGHYFGVPEDAASGSANSCLGGYLLYHHAVDGDSLDIRVEQGYEMKRPSRIHVSAKRENGTINVKVGGKVVMLAKGEWY